MGRPRIVALVLAGLLVVTGVGFALAQWRPSGAVLVGAGDIASCEGDQDEQTAKLVDAIPGTVFTAGDNAYESGTLQQFQDCYERSWGRFKERTRPTPGNHDYETSDASGYYAYFGAAAGPAGKGYYSYDLGGWHIVALNSSIKTDADSEQAAWLRADLAAHPTACTLAYWHYPLFSSGHHGDNAKVRPLWDILYQYGADVVINGHDHSYERFVPQRPDGHADWTSGIRAFVVGTGGADLLSTREPKPNSLVRSSAANGVLKLTLRPGAYSWEFIPVAGETFRDSGEAACVSPGAARR
jgi:hypothetical protein